MKRSELFFTFLALPVDIAMIIVSFAVAFYLRGQLEFNYGVNAVSLSEYLRYSFYLIPIWLVIFSLNDLYDREIGRGFANEFYRIFISNSVAILFLVLALFFSKTIFFSRLIMLFTWIASIVFVTLGRMILKGVETKLLEYGIGRRNVLLIGSNEVTEFIASEINRNYALGKKVVGVVNGNHKKIFALKQLGGIKDIAKIIKNRHIDEVILADTTISNDQVAEIIEICSDANVAFKFVPDIVAFMSLNVKNESIGSMPVLALQTIALDGWGRIVKRSLDVFFAVLFLILLSPILAMVALIVKTTSRGPVFFIHERVGRDNKRFKFYKFRSMYTELCDWKEEGKWTTAEDEITRITPFGRIIRKTNLDELPQLWNILIGDMSFVGPRPESPKLVEKFSSNLPQYLKRHRVKTGLTGWAQVNGFKGDTSITERVRYDTYYIENWSFFFDLKIILKTVWIMIYEIFAGKYEYRSRS